MPKPDRVCPLGNRVAVTLHERESRVAPDGYYAEDADPASGIIALIGTGVSVDLTEGSTVYFSRFDCVAIETARGVVHIVAVDKLLAKVV